MEVLIKSMKLGSFKGCKERVIEFGKNNEILGENGVGKTTIATAWYWLVADRDYSLKANPNIRPLDVEESLPRVEVVLDIDGKEVSIAKQQKRTVSKPNDEGISRVSLTNSYEVNAVPKSERDFKAYLTDLGVDFELLLPLSHPDVFVGQKANEMRKVLFSMASEKTDIEIAKQTDGATDVVKLLENYTMEEVEAMNKSTLRKIKEDYGKDGEILRAKIDGLESAKVDIDVAELELQKKAIQEQIKENQAKQDDLSKQYEEFNKLADEIMQLKFEQNELKRKANEKLIEEKSTLDKKYTDLLKENIDLKNQVHVNDIQTTRLEDAISDNERIIKICREKWIEINKSTLDEGFICGTCGQELPEDKQEKLKKEFETDKKTRLEKVTIEGNRLNEQIKRLKVDILNLETTRTSLDESLKLNERELNKLNEKMGGLPNEIDITDTTEYLAIQKQISDKEEVINKGNSAEEVRNELRVEQKKLANDLSEVERKIAESNNNVRIDEQIAELRAKQVEYEQSRADAEKVLYQLGLVSRRKNELLSEEINSHFELVEFKLFDYQKNGEYKEVCVPNYKGKDLNVATNTGLEMLMKLDIIKGLQKFYNKHYPVFLDGAESLSKETKERVNLDCQITYLTVNEEKELKIK